ncbi:MAG TPA: hypothetical protein PLQ93_11365 [Bacteroidia bacterium]|nr:hypothetical protein [Bacteroidia bacterium]
MKTLLIAITLTILGLSACSPSQEIVATWVDKEHLPKVPYKKVFVLGLVQDNILRAKVENKLRDELIKRGKTVVTSSELFPAKMSETKMSNEELIKIIKGTGCDLVFTVALLDVKTTQTYQPGSSYSPYGYGPYGSYYGYYGYYAPYTSSPGYYVTDRSYYVETNFYDVSTDKLICSVQSVAYNPSSFDSWYFDYSRLLIYTLKKEGVVKN